jgi:hypothetical protein
MLSELEKGGGRNDGSERARLSDGWKKQHNAMMETAS